MNSHLIPRDGLTAFKSYWKSDIISGFLVFLIALPLSLGIAKASGFPPIAGIYTAIIGGVVVSFFSGTPMSIKGPAAGLIVIAISSVEELGQGNMFHGYKLTIAVIAISGIIQILFGLLKTGKYSDFFPSSAVHGMLAAIGIIIISKQFHIALGVKPEGKNPLELLAEIPNSIVHMNPSIACIGISSLLILFLLPRIKSRIIKKIPAPLFVLLVAVPLGIFFNLDHAHDYIFNRQIFKITPEDYLVVLPQNILSGITFPDFSEITSLSSIKYIVMFSLVGSVESLLSSKAVDSLDPLKRKSKMNKDLLAIGIGNTIAGFIGGLPMISEIVRSSANINSGAMSRWANFYHGVFLLLFVSLATALIHYIPNAALAAMLMFTGYRLASPRAFHKTYKIGSDQLTIFLVTIVVTLATDLLLGIASGIITELGLYMFHGIKGKDFFSAKVILNNQNDKIAVIKLENAAIFSNFISFKKYIDNLPHDKHLVIDLTKAKIVDHTFMEHLQRYSSDFQERGKILEIRGLEFHQPFSDHPLSGRRVNTDDFSKIEIKLNPRQLELRDFAWNHNMTFIPFRISGCRKINGFSFAKNLQINSEENILIENTSLCKIEISDVQALELYDIHNEEFTTTIVHVSEFDFELPNFTLRKEKRFVLKGGSEVKVRNFFTPDIIATFNDLPAGVYVEFYKNSIIFYKKKKVLTVEELVQVYSFTTRLVEAINGKSLVFEEY